MKAVEIKKGIKYTDGKGNIREVVDIGPQYVLYSGQACQENLQYKLVAKKRGPHPVGSTRNSTIASFASWAKSTVS
jgi:hypothetical protein